MLEADDAQMAVDVTQAYMNWVGGTASKYWSSYGGMYPGEVGGGQVRSHFSIQMIREDT